MAQILTMLCLFVKVYGFEKGNSPEVRYSQGACVGTEERKINGTPESRYVSTSFAERNNLTMRMSMRRFTRLTNAFSKKVDNLACALAFHFMYYNFCRIHQSLRVTPAMAAKVTNKLWEIEDIVALLGDKPKVVIKRKRRAKRAKVNLRNRLFPYLSVSQQVDLPPDNNFISN